MGGKGKIKLNLPSSPKISANLKQLNKLEPPQFNNPKLALPVNGKPDDSDIVHREIRPSNLIPEDIEEPSFENQRRLVDDVSFTNKIIDERTLKPTQKYEELNLIYDAEEFQRKKLNDYEINNVEQISVDNIEGRQHFSLNNNRLPRNYIYNTSSEIDANINIKAIPVKPRHSFNSNYIQTRPINDFITDDIIEHNRHRLPEIVHDVSIKRRDRITPFMRRHAGDLPMLDETPISTIRPDAYKSSRISLLQEPLVMAIDNIIDEALFEAKTKNIMLKRNSVIDNMSNINLSEENEYEQKNQNIRLTGKYSSYNK